MNIHIMCHMVFDLLKVALIIETTAHCLLWQQVVCRTQTLFK